MMNFKNIFGILAISAVSMMTVSCSEDIMDRINKDEAHPGESVVSAKFQLTDAIVSSVFTTNTGNFAWYVASYTEQILGTGNNQLKNAELRSINETAAASTFDNEWNGTYLNLNNIQQMIAKCEEGGNSAGQLDIKAMGQILAAYDWGIMTDLFGNIPCSEAFKVSAPKLDTQEDIYKHILELLDAAKGNLDQAIAGNMKNAGAFDVLFNGNLTQWRGLAHALKARYLLHEVGRATDKNAQYAQILEEANAAVADGFNGADYYGAPAELGLMTPGDKEAAGATSATNFPLWFWNGVNEVKIPSHLMSKSELYFIIAEVKARLGQNAKADFETAVKASLADYATVGATEFSAEDVAAYLAGETAAKFAANPLSEILVQKYIAQTRDEQLETFNDMRRCKYLDGSYPVAMTNPNNTQAGQNRLPLRLPYGSSDVLSNPNVKEAFGSGNDAGKYIFTENVWWAGGSR